MSVILTQKYKHLIEKEGFDRVFHIVLSFFPLLMDVIKSGKLVEIVSFGIWELRYKLGLYSKDQYIIFDDSEPFIIKDGDEVGTLDFESFTKNQPFEIKRIQNWKLIYKNSENVIFGCLASDDKVLYGSKDDGKTIYKIKEFERGISSIFVSFENILFVNTWGTLYRSSNLGNSFELSLTLSQEDSYIYHNNGMTEIPSGELLIGEYGNVSKNGVWANLAYIYASSDSGKTWKKSDFLKKKGINKHVHLIKYSKLLNRIVLTDGDNKKKLWLSSNLNNFDLLSHPWQLINRFHIQIGGYTSMVENESKVFLGTDYLGGTNFLVETKDGKKYKKKLIPDPYRRSPIMNLLRRVSKENDEIWAILNNQISSNAKCLLMCSKNGGKSWSRILECDGTKNLILINSAGTKPSNTISIALTSSKIDADDKNGVSYEIRDKNNG